MYVDSGALPVKLVSSWRDSNPRQRIDPPSLGYKVMFELRPKGTRCGADSQLDLPGHCSLTSGKDSALDNS